MTNLLPNGYNGEGQLCQEKQLQRVQPIRGGQVL